MKRRRFESSPELEALLLASPTLVAPTAAEAPELDVFEGVMSLHPRGFGFVTTAEGDAFFVAEHHTRGLMDGDRLRFSAGLASAKREPELQRVRLVMRPAGRLLCALHRVGTTWALLPDEPCAATLQLPAGFLATSDLADGEVLAVHVPAYTGQPTSEPVQVQVMRRMGLRGREGFNLDYARVRYDFDAEMGACVRAQAEAAPVTEGDQRAWLSPMEFPFVTIDGESTRDIDDAVWAGRTAEGGWDLKVAIADVSWFVRPGTELDAWAMRQGTSLYLPGKVVPMLPEALSSGVCSLFPGVVRRAAVLSLTLSAHGDVVSSSLSRAFIQSEAQLTYGQVAAFMAGKNIRFSVAVERNLVALAELYSCLSVRRGQQGKLDFDEAEPSVALGADGAPALRWTVRTDAHKLVEELMLVANREAAQMLISRYGTGLFRHQPPPSEVRWDELRSWASRKTDQALPEAPSLRAMVSLVDGQLTADAKAGAAIRVRSTMQPARYVVPAAGAAGHFSLNFEWYTHFSSPIRRYADLLVHRLLLAPDGAPIDEALASQVAYCSMRALAARQAERWVWDRLKQDMLLKDVARGTPVAARVVRVTARGARVVLQGWQCSAWLAAARLRAQGYQWSHDAWVAPESGQPVVDEGTLVQVSWTHVDTTRPAYPEVHVSLVQGA